MALLHQVWVGGPLPPLFMRYAEGWRELHPEWHYILWRDCPEEFQVYDLFSNAARYVPEANVGQFKSDLLRYEVLYNFGGIYVDTDMEPRKPIDDLIGPECWAAWETTDVWIGNAVMGAEPKAAFLERVIEALPRSLAENRGRRPNISTGPHLVTKLYFNGPKEELTVYDRELFYPYSWSEPERADEEFPQARGVHHWANKTGLGR